jgi:ribosomal-protein-alanine N-acetyltransferase
LTLEDAPQIFFLRSDPGILQFLNKEPAANIQEAENFIQLINDNIDTNEAILWGICLPESPGHVIGTICYWRIRKENHRAEIGYVLHPDHWRKGIMKEAIFGIFDYGYKVMGLHSIEAVIAAGNKASAAVLESTGFVQEGYLREDVYVQGKFQDTVIYSRLQ